MYREFIHILENWENDSIKEPLLVTGARQVGKTWIIKKFCSEQYADWLYLNFESDPSLSSVFEDTLNPRDILRRLSILSGKKIDEHTAIFFDEIQRCEQAITSFKYFCEAPENYRIIGAGSLLGVKLNRFETSFPVGKVRIVKLYPMNFHEFLLAAGEDMLADEIQKSFSACKPLPEALHNKALHLYHDYLYIGGMPQCVDNFIRNQCDSLQFDRELQHFIHLAYGADMTKYTTSAAEGAKITAIYDSVPRQLARENPKFKYKDVRGNANRRDFYLPLDWLSAAGMVIRVTKNDLPRTPLKVYEDPNNFKLYLSDAGLLSFAAGVQYRDLLPSSDHIFKGAVAENYVMQEVLSSGSTPYYYKPDNSMEIDLLLELDGDVIPVEIKSGRHKRSTSLKKYNEKFSPRRMLRISENNFGFSDRLVSVPLYAVFCLFR